MSFRSGAPGAHLPEACVPPTPAGAPPQPTSEAFDNHGAEIPPGCCTWLSWRAHRGVMDLDVTSSPASSPRCQSLARGSTRAQLCSGENDQALMTWHLSRPQAPSSVSDSPGIRFPRRRPLLQKTLPLYGRNPRGPSLPVAAGGCQHLLPSSPLCHEAGLPTARE